MFTRNDKFLMPCSHIVIMFVQIFNAMFAHQDSDDVFMWIPWIFNALFTRRDNVCVSAQIFNPMFAHNDQSTEVRPRPGDVRQNSRETNFIDAGVQFRLLVTRGQQQQWLDGFRRTAT